MKHVYTRFYTKTQWNKPISFGLVATQNELACFLVGRNSSVGRALD